MKSLPPISVALLFVLFVCIDARDSFAQRATGGMGMGGMQGGMGMGGMGMGGMQSGMGMGGMGMGGMQGGMGGMQGGMGMNNQQLRQMQQMQLGLPGGAMGQNAFVGGDAMTTQGFFQNMGVGQQRAMGQNLMIENLNERRADRGQQVGRGAEPPPVRVQLRPAFETPEIGSAMVTSNIRSRLQQRLAGRNITGVDIQVAGRSATLVGTVSSEHERALLARIVRMEPGISEIENQLVVEPPTE
jgi:hypothetical protein